MKFKIDLANNWRHVCGILSTNCKTLTKDCPEIKNCVQNVIKFVQKHIFLENLAFVSFQNREKKFVKKYILKKN